MHRWNKPFWAAAGAASLAAFIGTQSWASVPAAPAIASTPTQSLQVFGRTALSSQQRAATPNLAKLDHSLINMKLAYDAGTGNHAAVNLQQQSPKARLRYSSPLAAPKVLVDVIVKGDPQVAKKQLQQLGFEPSAVFHNDIGGWVPMDKLSQVVALTNLRFVKTAMMHTRVTPTGPVAIQGDYVQRSYALKQSLAYPGLTGKNITVGIMSDSFDCAGQQNAAGSTTHLSDYADDVALQALPPDVNVIEEDPGSPCTGTDEGRALAQIVYAVAPGVKLAFYTADGSEADFAQGILTLALPTSQTDPNGNPGGGAQIIDDDVGYFDEPIFQEGNVGVAIDQVAAQGVLYFSSAGNEGRNSWESDVAATQFTGAPATGAPNATEKLLNMDTSGATQTYYLPITIPALASGDSYVISLFWDQPYQSSTGDSDPGNVIGDAGVGNGPGAASVLDFCIGDTSGNVPSTGTIGKVQVYNGPLGNPTNCAGPSNNAPVPPDYAVTQPGDKDPYNFLEIYNPSSRTSVATQASIVVGLVSGPAPGRVKVLIQDDGRGTQIGKFATASSTIQGHPLSPNAMAVGAAFYYRTPLCDNLPTAVPETFTSAGGTPFLFDAKGNALAQPQVLQKPNIVAPDGITTTFFGSAEGTISSAVPQCQLSAQFPFNFSGTSAAAPHAAGVAALLLQADPTAKPSDIYTAMQNSALDMNTPGFDYDTGFGFLQADAAIAALLPAQLTLAPTSLTFSSAGTQTVTVTNSGTGPLTVSNVLVTPAGITQTNNCPAMVPAGGNCTITLTLAASGAAGNKGALTFATNAQGLGGSASVPISIPAQVTVAPQSVKLVANQGGTATSTVTVTNSGVGQLTVSSVSVTPSEVTQTNTCTAPLAAGASCTVTLTLNGANGGFDNGALTVATNATNATGGTASVAVSTAVSSGGGGGAFGPWMLLPGLALAGLRRRRRV